MNDLITTLVGELIDIPGIASKPEDARLPNLQKDYTRFLSLCNGGYTRNHFFHFFGRQGVQSHNLFDWNRVDVWKTNYSLDSNCFVFAENIFGFQYFFDTRADRKVVKMLDLDTGKINLCANTFEDFVEDEVFSDDFNSEDRDLAEQFIDEKAIQFKPFTHIACKKPVLLGGKNRDIENLELVDSLINLSVTGQLVRQLRDLPPGTPINKITFRGPKLDDKL